MNAIVYRRYGSPDVLSLQDVPKPSPKDGDVLVRVHAAALNPFDWHLLRGKPYIVRQTAGWRTPKRNIPGIDVAGVVEAVGPDVTQFQPGDEVFGEKSRACAEYVSGPEKLFVRKPANLTLEEAAAVPVAGATALQALRDKGQVKPGQRVLINGASGGVGTFAVQLAKSFGAEVTGVCSTPNVELARATRAPTTSSTTRVTTSPAAIERYDLIIDNAGNHSLLALRRVLAPTGWLVIVGAPKGNWIAPLARIVGAQILSSSGVEAALAPDGHRPGRPAVPQAAHRGGHGHPDHRPALPAAQVAEGIRYLETMRAAGRSSSPSEPGPGRRTKAPREPRRRHNPHILCGNDGGGM